MTVVFAAVLIALAFVLTPTASSLGMPNSGCVSVGESGETALRVAFQGEVIAGQLNASGCTIGIYIPPGANFVSVQHATITGATDQGILAQDVTGLRILDSLITGNGGNYAYIPDEAAIELVGTTNSTVSGNVVTNNTDISGISLTDDGMNDPGGLPIQATKPVPSAGNELIGNYIVRSNSSGIIVDAWNRGAGILGNRIMRNTVLGPTSGNPDDDDGGIVVAADQVGSSTNDTTVEANTVIGSLLPGILVHIDTGGAALSGTVIVNNVVSGNGGFSLVSGDSSNPDDPQNSTGIALVAEDFPSLGNPSYITNTTVSNDDVSNDVYGIWTCFAPDTSTTITGLFGNVTTEAASCPAPSVKTSISVSQSGTADCESTNVCTVMLPSTVKAGDVLLVFVPGYSHLGNWTAQSVTDTFGNTFSSFEGVNWQRAEVSFSNDALYAMVSSGGGSDSVTITLSSKVEHFGPIVVDVTGDNLSIQGGVTTYCTVSCTSDIATGWTSVSGTYLAAGAAYGDQGTSVEAGTGWTGVNTEAYYMTAEYTTNSGGNFANFPFFDESTPTTWGDVGMVVVSS